MEWVIDAAGIQDGTLSPYGPADGGHVKITNDRGVVLDDFAVSVHDFSNRRVVIRTESQFVIRSDS